MAPDCAPASHAGLREFQLQLSRRLQQAESQRGTTRDCVAASTGARHWLFDLAYVSEVIAVPSLTTVPFTRPWYLGLINHRGELTGVIDLDGLSGALVRSWRETDRLLVLSAALPCRCAIRVAQLAGILDRAALREAGRDQRLPDWAPAGFDDAGGVRRQWVDVESLMRDPAFIDIGCR